MSGKFAFLESMDLLNSIHHYHTVLIAFVAFWFAWFFAKKIYQTNRNSTNSDEFNRKLDQWRPEPLITDVPKDHPSLNPRKITSRIGKIVTIDGQECLNLGTHNYLGLIENNEIEKKAIETIKKYGVGSCGPRGFYGTVDVHLELEERLAEFMQMEEAVVYSYGFSTIASAIPAYCKRKDLVFVDEKVNFSIQKGLDASRSNIKYFKHNDVQDLERLIKAQNGLNKKNSKNVEITRKFLIVEGIYMNTGTICPLPELVALARKYKLRIFVDESISFGTLGNSGHGVTEYFNICRHEIDMIMGSLEWAVSSVGGFCVGSSFIIEHQRLSGLGYCFSASLPPLLTSAAITSLDIMENKPELFKKLQENCLLFDRGVKNIEAFECPSDAVSPVKHLYLRNICNKSEEQIILEKISNECFENKLAVIIPAYLHAEREYPRPSLRICISAVLNESEIRFALLTLEKCVKKFLI
ncbi:serine palmitoyltransferase 1 [Phymastichus coffea]|uniref:serine palmitoyltransferase 1 n=1 Tax=Phymastichus coffea TaxID=108790 RepID=UPI00273C7CCF|nr:serine palmitoyltransferase 1 [Phymastichus coffea]